MQRMGANTSSMEDAQALAGGDEGALRLLFELLITQERKGRKLRGIMTIMMLDQIGCYEAAITDLYRECDEVFEEFYFRLARLSNTPEFLLP